MSKQLTLKNIRDEKQFYLSIRRKIKWTVVGKSKGIVTIQSENGSTRFKPVSTVVYDVK